MRERTHKALPSADSGTTGTLYGIEIAHQNYIGTDGQPVDKREHTENPDDCWCWAADSQAPAEATAAPETKVDGYCWDCNQKVYELPHVCEPQQPKTDELDKILDEFGRTVIGFTRSILQEEQDDELMRDGLDKAQEAIRQLFRTERVSELEALEEMTHNGRGTILWEVDEIYEHILARIATLKGENR